MPAIKPTPFITALASCERRRGMPATNRDPNRAIRETAYYIWQREGCPHGRAEEHWLSAKARLTARRLLYDDQADDEEKVLAGRPDVNLPALLTRDVPGG
jgi:Protein of unknown function (DUF2934)